ncbi:hypothetical protein CCP3SC1AL1_990006 [Gammaproteobacteria bacterium]
MSRNFTPEEKERILTQYAEANKYRYNNKSIVYSDDNKLAEHTENENKYELNKYNEVFNKQDKLSLLQEPSIVYKKHCYYLNIDSQDRDVVAYPSVNNYSVTFAETYKNVTRVELVNANIPNQAASGSILNEGYLIIDIPELNNMEFTKTGQNKGFTILPLKNASSAPDGGFIVPELSCMFNTPLILRTPIASLSRLNIKIKGRNGVLFNFGESGGSVLTKYQNCFTFKITTEEKDRSTLQYRNVY